MKTVSVAFCFNDKYCTLAAAAISSLVKHTSPDFVYNIYVIYNELSDFNKYLLDKLVENKNIFITFLKYNVNQLIGENIYTPGYFSSDIYVRLFLHKLLPDLDKVLYLDSDVIVNCDVSEIYNIDLGKYAIGACIAKGFTAHRLKVAKIPGYANVDFKRYSSQLEYYNNYVQLTDQDLNSYFNSGVLLFNLKKTAMVVDSTIYEYINKKYIFPDQDILNILFKNNKLILDPKYNVGISRLEEYIREFNVLPCIIHYASPVKPTSYMEKPGAINFWQSIAATDFYYMSLDNFINMKLSLLENKIYRNINNTSNLEDLFYDLNRIRKSRTRRKYIKLIIKVLVDHKEYKKLQRDSDRFFADSKSRFIQFLGKFYK